MEIKKTFFVPHLKRCGLFEVFWMLRNENIKVYYCTINGAVFISDINKLNRRFKK